MGQHAETRNPVSSHAGDLTGFRAACTLAGSKAYFAHDAMFKIGLFCVHEQCQTLLITCASLTASQVNEADLAYLFPGLTTILQLLQRELQPLTVYCEA